jgi:serine/threonine protein kinase
VGNLEGRSLGRYHILEQLGEDGEAIVYKAFDIRLENEVAVKVAFENLLLTINKRRTDTLHYPF